MRIKVQVPRRSLPPGALGYQSKRHPNGGGQYTNTDSAAQEKGLEFGGRGGPKVGQRSAAGAAPDELVEEELGEPGVVVADHAVLMEYIAGDVT